MWYLKGYGIRMRNWSCIAALFANNSWRVGLKMDTFSISFVFVVITSCATRYWLATAAETLPPCVGGNIELIATDCYEQQHQLIEV